MIAKVIILKMKAKFIFILYHIMAITCAETSYYREANGGPVCEEVKSGATLWDFDP